MFILRWILILICLVLTVTYSIAIGHIVFTFIQDGELTANITAFGIGGFVFFMLWLIFHDFWKNLMGVFTHELTHAVACVLSLSHLKALFVDRTQGSGHVICVMPNTLVLLSPYFFPILTIIPVVLIAFFKDEYIVYLYGIIGFTTMYHIITFATQFRPFQPDLRRVGFFTSTVYVIFGNVFFIGLILALLTGEFEGMWEFIKAGLWFLVDWLSNMELDLPISISGSE